MMVQRIITIRFYGPLNDFLFYAFRQRSFVYKFTFNQSVKDAIEALGVPHVEVAHILVNNKISSWDYHLANGDRVAVYPVFYKLTFPPGSSLIPALPQQIRFVLDVHLGKLCRYMRLLGIDTIYRNDIMDSEIIEISVKEERIVLTRDLGILRHGKVKWGYFLRSDNSKEQLNELLLRYPLREIIAPFSRCIACNGTLVAVEKERLNHQVPIRIQKIYDRFIQCTSCRKIYWEGSHYDRMREFLEGLEI